jgi:hypothetical protein
VLLLVFVRVQVLKHHSLYLGFLKEPKSWDKNKKLKGPKIRDGGVMVFDVAKTAIRPPVEAYVSWTL